VTVHPGSFCAPLGATGLTNAETPMICRVGPKGGRARWGRNGPSPAKPSTGRRRAQSASSGTPLPAVDAGIDPYKVPEPAQPPAEPVATPDPAPTQPSEAKTVTMPPCSPEEIKPPNGAWDRDQGRMHMNSAIGRLWAGLGDDGRRYEVDGHALGNVLADLATGISFRHHDTNHALAELRRIRGQFPDGSDPASAIDRAIGRLDAPARPAPALPDNAPPQMRTLMEELNAIPLVRRGYDIGSNENSPYHETDKLAELGQRWARGEVGMLDMQRGVAELGRGRHESSEGWVEIGAAVRKALQDVNQWGRRPRR